MMTEPVVAFQVRRIAFEYEDHPGTYKERPVVVGAVNGERTIVLLAKVTGHGPRPEYPGEVRLTDWHAAGLAKPSVVRCPKTVEVELSDVEGTPLLGELSEADRRAVRTGLYESGKIATP